MGLGDPVYATGGLVTVEVLSASSALTSDLYLDVPLPVTFIATNRDVGTIVTLGPFSPGVELIFALQVPPGAGGTGGRWFTGDASRNADGVVHASADPDGAGCIIVGFEDLSGGGDHDYNDCVFRMCGITTAQDQWHVGATASGAGWS